MTSAPRYLATFDSASAMARALGSALGGDTYRPVVGARPLALAAAVLNHLPYRLRQGIYALGGHIQAIPQRDISEVDPERISEWICGAYPRRRYPAVFIGSSNGAAMHLAAALGVPWLPQTTLIPVRQPRLDPDDAESHLQAARGAGLALVEQYPELALHHMHDPNQDRLMVRYMTYFRVKRRRLGETYEAFLEDVLEPGGTIFVLDCGCSWPVAEIAPRYVFQLGGVGGASAAEMSSGGPRVAEFLRAAGSDHRQWRPPALDFESPESEWGFAAPLDDDIRRFAGGRYEVVRLAFGEPETLSPLVADLLRQWYTDEGVPPTSLLVDSFVMLDPGVARRMGAVPYWSKFSVESSHAGLARYLSGRERFGRIGMAQFAHGVRSLGFVPAERWLALAREHADHVELLGVDPRAHPADLAVYFRYPRAIRRFADRDLEMPPLPLATFRRFLAEHGARYHIDFQS